MIIGISGKAGSGKNTICDMIIYLLYCEKYNIEPTIKHFKESIEESYKLERGTGWSIMSFANRLKECVSSLSDYEIDLNEEQGKNSLVSWLEINGRHPSYRELLQWFGTTIRQSVCDDFWIQALFSTIREDENILISDVRFKNEVESIKNRNGVVIRVNRNNSGAGNHISEIDLDDYPFDHIIDNNGSLEDLLFKVKHLLIELL